MTDSTTDDPAGGCETIAGPTTDERRVLDGSEAPAVRMDDSSRSRRVPSVRTRLTPVSAVVPDGGTTPKTFPLSERVDKGFRWIETDEGSHCLETNEETAVTKIAPPVDDDAFLSETNVLETQTEPDADESPEPETNGTTSTDGPRPSGVLGWFRAKLGR
jgi:hypothetical protein